MLVGCYLAVGCTPDQPVSSFITCPLLTILVAIKSTSCSIVLIMYSIWWEQQNNQHKLGHLWELFENLLRINSYHCCKKATIFFILEKANFS